MIAVKTFEDRKLRQTTISLEFAGEYVNTSIKSLNNTSNGTWLFPHVIDNFVSLITTNKLDPTIQTIPQNTLLSWKLDVKDSVATDWHIAFVKMILVDRTRRTYMKKSSWERIFKLGINDQVAPDGSLYVGKNNSGKFSIITQAKIASKYLIKYSIDFNYSPKGKAAIFYNLDPYIKIHDEG